MAFNDLKKKIEKHKNREKGFLLVLLISVIFMFVSAFSGITLLIVVGILSFMASGIIVLFLSEHDRVVLEEELFKECILPLLNENFSDFKCSPEGINPYIVKNLNFIDTGDSTETCYANEGIYKGISFVSSGLVCQKKVININSDNDWITLFSGRVYIIGASVLKGEGYVDILDSKTIYHKSNISSRKVTLNHEIESEFDIYVDDASLSLPVSFLDYIKKI